MEKKTKLHYLDWLGLIIIAIGVSLKLYGLVIVGGLLTVYIAAKNRKK